MCSTVQEQITTCGQNAIVKIGERTNIRPQKWQAKTTGAKYHKYVRFRKKGNILGLGHFLYTCECDDERACYLIIKKHVYSKTKYVNIPSFLSSHHFNSPLKLKFSQSTFAI